MKLIKKQGLILFGLVIAAFLIAASFFSARVMAITTNKEGVICEGIFVNGVNLSGKTVEEANKLLKEQIENLMVKKISIEIVTKDRETMNEEVSLSEVGFEVSGEEIVEEVVKIGTEGNLIERYKALKDAENNKPDYKLDFRYDENKLDSFLKTVSEKYQVEAEDAGLTRENKEFKIKGGKTGFRFNEETMEADIKGAVDRFVQGLPETLNEDIRVQAELQVIKPKYDKEDLAKVTDLLGTYTTSYGTAVSGRTLNIVNGAKLIDGTLILPGEIMSANKKMFPYTIANGYHMGGAFLNGKVVDDIGGGICQVSSTLYNASLYAEIGIESRQNHSMTVSYVPLARDAAIAGDFKDLVIKNNREYPIYLEAITGGGRITFNIYGHETRDTVNRKVDFETVTLQTIPPGKEIVEKDPKKPKDYKKVVQGAWTGYKTELYKIVKVNGVQTERTLVNKSNYKSNPAYVIKGTKKVKKKVPEEVEEIDEEIEEDFEEIDEEIEE